MEKHILKKLAWLYMACAMVMPVAVLTGCSDDDDDDGGNASAETLSEVSAFTGTDGSTFYLTKVYSGSTTYLAIEYDEDNDYIMTSWKDENYDEYELTSESPLKYENTENDDDYTEIYQDFKTNSSGYLTSFTWKEDEDDLNASITCSFSYNNKGQLTKISTKGNYYDGEYTLSVTVTVNVTWEDDVITKAESSTSLSDNEGYSETDDETYEYSYDNDEYENATLQYPAAGSIEIFEYIFYALPGYEPFPYIGWLGIGPKYWPTSCVYSWYWYYEENYDGEEDSEEDSYTESYSYKFNSDGSLYKCGSDYYSYLDDESTEKSLSITEQNDTETLKNLHKTRLSDRLRNKLRHTSTEE